MIQCEFLLGASTAAAKSLIDTAINRDEPFISFHWLTNDRMYAYLVHALTRVGGVGIKAGSASRARKLLPLGEFLTRTKIVWRRPTHSLISEQLSGEGIIHISRHYYSSSEGPGRLFMPYYAHPDFYKSGIYKSVAAMRQQARIIRVFFAGAVTAKYSDRFAFPALMTRDLILDHVIDSFGHISVSHVTGIKRETPLLMLISRNDEAVFDITKHKLSVGQYMELMSDSDFFICPPGWLMPHSHNIIEAMSVGTIPITNYPHYMRPALTPNKNCLSFSTLEELQQVIKRALSMPRSEIESLRSGVISYYEKYLEPESFGRLVRDNLATLKEIVVNDESAR